MTAVELVHAAGLGIDQKKNPEIYHYLLELLKTLEQ